MRSWPCRPDWPHRGAGCHSSHRTARRDPNQRNHAHVFGPRAVRAVVGCPAAHGSAAREGWLRKRKGAGSSSALRRLRHRWSRAGTYLELWCREVMQVRVPLPESQGGTCHQRRRLLPCRRSDRETPSSPVVRLRRCETSNFGPSTYGLFDTRITKAPSTSPSGPVNCRSEWFCRRCREVPATTPSMSRSSRRGTPPPARSWRTRPWTRC